MQVVKSTVQIAPCHEQATCIHTHNGIFRFELALIQQYAKYPVYVTRATSTRLVNQRYGGEVTSPHFTLLYVLCGTVAASST